MPACQQLLLAKGAWHLSVTQGYKVTCLPALPKAASILTNWWQPQVVTYSHGLVHMHTEVRAQVAPSAPYVPKHQKRLEPVNGKVVPGEAPERSKHR
jgi:hypothetical protein